jgi:hypothetical protein
MSLIIQIILIDFVSEAPYNISISGADYYFSFQKSIASYGSILFCRDLVNSV